MYFTNDEKFTCVKQANQLLGDTGGRKRDELQQSTSVMKVRPKKDKYRENVISLIIEHSGEYVEQASRHLGDMGG